MNLRIACALAALLTLPAAPSMAQTASAAQPAAAAALTISGQVPAAPADKGQVVFFRKSSFMGMPYWTNVRENEVAYGKLTNGTYFVKTLEPGVHEFNTSVLGKDSLKIQVDPGETYYVEGKITMALVGYTIIMEPSDADHFQKLLKGMKPAKSEPEVATATAK